jgi:hypothetical protein
MNQHARVESLEALKDFRISLVKFADTARAGLESFDGDIRGTVRWLTEQQSARWTAQIKKRAEKVRQAKVVLNQKKLFKTARDIKRSYVEEEKALALAERRLAEAREKLENVNKWIRELDRNIPIYRGRVRKMADSVEIGVPKALAHLDRLLDSLDSYVALAPKAADVPPAGSEDLESIARGGEAEEHAAGDDE